MEITYILVADAANMGQGNKVNVLGVFNTIRYPAFPAAHPQMSVVFSMRLSPLDRGKALPLDLILVDDDGREIVKYEIEVSFPDIQIDEDSPHVSSTESAVFNLVGVPFPHPGLYRFEVRAEDSHKEWPLDVVLLRMSPERTDAQEA